MKADENAYNKEAEIILDQLRRYAFNQGVDCSIFDTPMYRKLAIEFISSNLDTEYSRGRADGILAAAKVLKNRKSFK